MKEKISIVMPVYNQAKVIPKIIDSYCKEVIEKLPGSEFIVAEDGSTDGTKEALAELSKKYPIRLVSGKKRKGYTKAVKDALKLPKNDVIFFSDSDGEHSPKDFWKLYIELENADIVIGFKENRKPFYRFFISRFNNFLIGAMFGLWLKDSNCGFRVMRKKLVQQVSQDVRTLTYASNAELAIRAFRKGFKVKEVPVQHFPAPSEVFPVSRMPKVILTELLDLVKLRLQV